MNCPLVLLQRPHPYETDKPDRSDPAPMCKWDEGDAGLTYGHSASRK
jgi:hypothetical protein